jgi:uncharacterized membrane protein YkvI
MMSETSEKIDTGTKGLALVAILGVCLIISGVIIKTMASYYDHTDPGWDYRVHILWTSMAHIVQAIGVLMISMSFIWTAYAKKRLHQNVRASLIIGSMILIALFILTRIARYVYIE